MIAFEKPNFFIMNITEKNDTIDIMENLYHGSYFAMDNYLC